MSENNALVSCLQFYSTLTRSTAADFSPLRHRMSILLQSWSVMICNMLCTEKRTAWSAFLCRVINGRTRI